ncbi:hypothetical protein KC19_1G000400 [Ceratodon purpureus]|uniref:RING-type domain-containing protein n=1 Tax=Ceratodon purpureus TaxID=3225 RepID=A0A8T0J0W5_CERPU|nr:hypothetical protein KC19_1G000400 [Ceratodon purpureus]
MMDQEEFSFAEDFGQKVDLTQRIREVLANYPEGTTILKELIQNADDAGATRVSFCLDHRRHGTDTLAYGPLAEWQGPALLAFNDAQFSEEDFESISRIGDSKKRGQAWKTGRFGVGFNSVYHLSDLPSFVSGNYVVMFDPHCKFLPRVSAANPGKRIDFINTGALQMYRDQFTPYCAFGCDMESPFPGTLFRFPLRSALQAAVSRLSKQVYSEEDMRDLLHDLYSEGVHSILFLKSVEVVEIYEWYANMSKPQQVYSISIKSPTAEIRWHRQAFTRLSWAPPPASITMGTHSDVYSLEFVSEVLMGPHQGEKRTESFLIAQCMGAAGSRIGVLAKSAQDYDLHLLPWASVAAKVSSNEEKAQDGVALEGQAFCFLPLPVRTGLPVHVNAYFELSSNRRDIWYGADMDRGGKLRSNWNRCLLEDVVAPAFSLVIVEASKQLGNIALYDSLWPCGNFVEPWLTMVKRFYSIAAELPLLYTAAGRGRWITPKQALYHDEEFFDAEGLAGALTAEGFPLVQLSLTLRNTLFKFCVSNPRMVLPSLVRAQLCKPGKHGGLVERSNALVMLEYCLEDVIDDEAGEVLTGLPLVPLADGTLGVFDKRSDADVFLICRDLEYRILESIPDKLVDQSIGEKLTERLRNIATESNMNLCRPTGAILVQLFARLLPSEWKALNEVEWNPDLYARHPRQDWLRWVWQHFREDCKDLSVFKDWPLLPTKSGHLCKFQTHSKIIREGVWSPSLESILTKVGCRILRNDMGVEHPRLSAYVQDGTAAGIVDTFRSITSQEPQQLFQAFEDLNIVERRVLREYLFDAKWYAGDEMNEERLMVVRTLPIFEVFTGSSGSSARCVDLVRSKLFLAPLGMDETLLSPDFVRTYSDREVQWLTGPLKVKHLERPLFYKWRVLNRLHELPPVLRDSMMLSILRELPQLAAVDSSFREALKQLPFVPVGSGALHAPKSLYDPRSPELTMLLDDQECFPAGVFLKDEALDMLQGLGLRVAVLPETILQSARQVEALLSTDGERALKKGRDLLLYMELNTGRWLLQRPLDDPSKSLGRMFQKVSAIFQPPDLASDTTLDRFWLELSNLSWCPVLMHPPHPHLPWPAVGSPVAPPKHVALQDDMWLLSASMRILDGDCGRSSALASKLGWSSLPTGRRLAAQLLELGKNHVVVQDRVLGQALATVVPRIYTLLNEMLGSDEMEIVKAVLEGSRWVWVGDGFANVEEVAFSGPLHLAPFLRIIPADLAVFKELLLELDVRETLTPNEFALVLSNMAKVKEGAPLDSQQLSAAVWLVQHLADLHFNSQEVIAFVPDSSSTLVAAHNLVYNDAPWLHGSEGEIGGSLTGSLKTSSGPRFAHPKISTDVAERMGVRSLRRMLLAESADSMDLGLHDAAEAFGQHEALTTRLKHIVEMYADGPGILCELVQNADDAGAKEVKFLLDRSTFGTSSVLSPNMADWQGPALYCQNDSVFTPRDLYAISRIGQDSKLERPSAIGRFGLGFNSVYHFTDIPGFVSGSNLVMFDPHVRNLPGVTPSHPGLKISFVGRGLLEQFPDQLQPYLLFGCDLQRPYPGTLFRFPLRTEKTAINSEIKQGAYSPNDVVELFWSFKSSAEEAMLFLRNVASISVYVRDDLDQDMQLLYQVKRPGTTMQSSVYEFVRGSPQNPTDKEQFYAKLTKTPDLRLPKECEPIEILLTTAGVQQSQKWLISTAMGGGRARNKAIALENRSCGFIPWAGIAAPLHLSQFKEATNEDGDEIGIARLADDAGSSESQKDFEGRAFCFLPLPVKIGLPVHVNGYFELSSNRRDIWYGDDMVGGGKLRADWNRCLLEDVAAPAYARLLLGAAGELGPTAQFYALWPTGSVSEPWLSMVKQVYTSVVDLDLPVLYTYAAQGTWVSPKKAVFPDNSFADAQELGNALAHAGLPIISAPDIVISKFRKVCPRLRHLTPSMLRRNLAASRRTFEGLAANVVALKYCLTDVEAVDAGEKLRGLSLVPLYNGSLATIANVGAGERILVATNEESLLLKDAVSYMLVDCGIASDVIEKLRKIAQHGGTNLTLLTGQVLEEILPRLVPTEWRSKGMVTWSPDEGSHPSLQWMQLLWKFLDSSCSDLSVFEEWPLLPTLDGHLVRLAKNSRVLRNDGWSENMVSVLQRAQCAVLRSDIQVNHPTLQEYVHDASAFGVLDALRAAVGGRLHALVPLLQSAPDGELRELCSFLCQSKWFVAGEMEKVHTDVLRSLPIFESFSISGRKFVDLPQDKRWFPPDGVSEELFGSSFIRAESPKEEDVLGRYLGVTKLNRASFYCNHLFSNMAQIPMAVATRAMLAAIQDFQGLVREDPGVVKVLSSLPFVLTARGTLEPPERLYDPRVPELQTLLNQDVFFPSGDFAADTVLDILVELGLRRSLGHVGLLDSARSVAMTSTLNPSEAVHRAKALLTHLDDLQIASESRVNETHADSLNSSERESGLGVSPKEGNSLAQVAAQDEAESKFWLELTNISWCPVLTSAPNDMIPWHQVLNPIAAPKLVRPRSQMWFVSATMFILDGECQSASLATKLGWEQHLNVSVLAAQLSETSKHYAQWQEKFTKELEVLQEFNAVVSKEVIPSIYKALQESIGKQDLTIVQDMLAGVPWVWVGEGFVSPKQLAFDSPAHFHPYLHIVPTEIVEFRKLLTTFGVRETFEAADYANVLLRIARDMNGGMLAPEQLTFCLTVLEALSEVLPPGENRVILGSVLMPDSSGVLALAKDLVFNDAPWLAKAATEMAGMRRLVHRDIDIALAERLGAKSLRYLSLVDQEMTSNLPCLDTSAISEVLSEKESDDLLLFDFLEAADCCKARKVHIMFDKREHSRQSLLQPNLGPFQGPALTIAFEGASLTTEEVCTLQTIPPSKIRGQPCQYGIGLLGAYHVTELLLIVSSGCLYLFDPPGQVLVASLADGRAVTSGGIPVGKAYALKGTDLAQRFSDQFFPLQVSSSLSWARPDATILRLPLRSSKQAAESKFKDAVECTDTDVARILDNFKSRASSGLLALKTVEDVSISVWEEGEARPHELFGVRIDPARALLRNPFQEKKWRNFKYQLTSIFGGSSSTSKVHTIDVLLTEDGKQIVDKWLVVQCLGSGHTRDMALDRKYLSYNLTPVAGVAAHLTRNGLVPDSSTNNYILAPLPVPILSGLPITIMGHFMVSRGVTRHLFKTLTVPDLTTSTNRSINGSKVSIESVATAWNKELLACVRDSYIELLQEIQRLRQDPSSSRADPPIGRGLDGMYGVPADRTYSLWPRSRALMSMGPDQPGAVEGQCLAEWLIKPMYVRLVESPMWQLHGGAMAKAADGMFLTPPGVEQQGMAPPATVCEFLKAHYRVFAVPWELTKEIEAAGVSAKELTPKMLRSLLRIPSIAAAVPSVLTQVDLLEFCCADLISEKPNSTPLEPENVANQPNGIEVQSISTSSRQPIGLQQAITGSRLRPSRVLRSEQQIQIEERPTPRVLDGRDPIEWFTDMGRAIVDLGAGVMNDISRDGPSAPESTSSEDHSTLNKSLVLELKGLLCPTATNQMSKLGVTDFWVGSKEQQDLLPSLASKFVHPMCVERIILADLFRDRVFQNLLKLEPFSSQVLAANLGAALPKHWISRGAAGTTTPWVGWSDSNVPLTGPSAEWLRMLWKNINVTSTEELALFSQWPLIPAVTSTPVLVRVGQRQLIFVPPVPQQWLPTSGLEDVPINDDMDGITRGYLELERQQPWLLPLLRNCHVPVYDRRFLDFSIVDVCMPPPEKSLPEVVVGIFLALQRAGCLSPLELPLTPEDCNALFLLFASFTSVGAAASAYSSEELDLLRLLPIYKTCTGSFVSLDLRMHCIVPPSVFFQPADDLCLEFRETSEGGSLYQTLGIPELADYEVIARFALPGFEAQPDREQERILAYLNSNWSALRQHENLMSVLSETKFVRNVTVQSSNVIDNAVLYRPSDLMDPESTLMKRIFADDPGKFPGGQFATPGWLAILRNAGLRSVIDPPLLLECAKKVDRLGKENFQDLDLLDESEAVSAGNNGVSIELWTTAGMLVEALLNNFASVAGTNFCEALGRLAFVPAERGIPGIGVPGSGRKVLAAYNEAVLVKDWPLAWTCAPILVKANVVPPEFSWGSFRLSHPPPFATVVKHLKMVGRNGGEDILARWPNVKGMRSVEDAFGDVLKYLTSVWDGLSDSDKDTLMELQFIPVANGTRLAAAGSLFARLGMDLVPFVFELPSAYLAYVDVLTSLRMKDSPTFESMRSLLLQLQRTCGYQRLNPNELQAVLRILTFVCDKSNRVRTMTSHVIPDPAEDAIVPDDSGRLLQARACVYIDSAGASLVGEIDSSLVRFVHPHVTEQLCVELGVRKLSEIIIEELDNNKSLEMLDSIGHFARSTISERLRSPLFADAMWAVVQEAGDGIPALKLKLSKEKLVKTLSFAADGLWFVRRLYTRFLMLPGRADVTRRRRNASASILDDDNGDTGHRVFEYVDTAKSRILIAVPSLGITLPDLLAVVLSRLIGSPVTLSIGALFTAPVGADFTVLGVLRLGLSTNNRGASNGMANSGVLGMELVGPDAALVQFHPLRPFHAGELVAWRPDGQGGLRYGRVLQDVRASAGQALYRLEVETGANEVRLLLSSQVLSFKGTASASLPVISLVSEENLQEAVNNLTGITDPVDRSHGDSPRFGLTSIKIPEAQEPSRGQVAGNVPAAEVVQAVRDMLAAAGLPMGAEQMSWLERSLTLQEQLTATDTSLLEEQRRADTAVKEAEAARSAWTCRICLTNEVDTIVIPCGHVLCQRCSTALSKCPFCRRQVTKCQRIYRP